MWWWGPCAASTCCRSGLSSSKRGFYEKIQPLDDMFQPTPETLGESEQALNQTCIAVDTRTRELVAIKSFPRHVLRRKETRRRMRQEIKMLALCRSHPHIITLYDVHESKNMVEIVFELAKGGDVLNRIRPHKLFYEGEVSRIVRCVLSALHFLHERRIIHGDIRPEHILYADYEPDSNVLLSDFGRAARFQHFTYRSRSGDEFLWENSHDIEFLPPLALTKSAEGVSTWEEAAQVDLWALGVTTFILLCGRFPFEGATSIEIQRSIAQQTSLVFPHDVSRAAKDFVTRLLQSESQQWTCVEEVARHPWIQCDIASQMPWPEEKLERFQEFSTFYAMDGALNSRRRSALASGPLSRGGSIQGLEKESEEVDERPSFVSTDGIGMKEDAVPPSADSYMRQADMALQELTFQEEVASTDNRRNGSIDGKGTGSVKKEEEEAAENPSLWRSICRQRRFFALKSLSSSTNSHPSKTE